MTRTLILFVSVLIAGPAFADHHEMPKPITPGPEHAFTKSGSGNWDVKQKMWHKPGAPPMEATGKMVAQAVMNGIGLAYEYTGDKQGEMPIFRGYGFTTWIPAKKHYESVWFDVFSYGGMTRSTGTWDEKTKTLTEAMSGPGPDGKPVNFKVVTVYPNNDGHTQTFFMKKDGKEMKTMELVYTRAK